MKAGGELVGLGDSKDRLSRIRQHEYTGEEGTSRLRSTPLLSAYKSLQLGRYSPEVLQVEPFSLAGRAPTLSR